MTPSELQHLRSVLVEAPEEIGIVHDVQCVYASTASEAFYEAARSAVPSLIEEVERLQRERRDSDKDRDHLLALLTDAHAGLYHLNRGERVEWSVPDLIARIAEELDQ